MLSVFVLFGAVRSLHVPACAFLEVSTCVGPIFCPARTVVVVGCSLSVLKEKQ